MDLKYGCVITGSIATGKSFVSKIIKDHGYEVIDADIISHKILDEQNKEIAKIFGEEFIDKKGKVKRKELGEIIFSNKKKKEKLENLLHVRIFDEINKRAEILENKKKIYFLDIPLYFETKNVYKVNNVCVVYAPKELQLKRLIKRENINIDEALKKIDSQKDIEYKKSRADFIIDNSFGKKNLEKNTINFLKKIEEKHASCKI